MFVDKKVEAKLLQLFAKDSEGNVYLRVVLGEPEGLANAVTPRSNKTISTLLDGCIATGEDGKPALRLASLDIPT